MSNKNDALSEHLSNLTREITIIDMWLNTMTASNVTDIQLDRVRELLDYAVEHLNRLAESLEGK